MAQGFSDLGDAALGGVYIGLHLAESDGSFYQPAVVVEDRILRILPALLEQAGLRLSRILDEAIAIDIPEVIDPIKSCANVGPDAAQELYIRGASIVEGSEKDEERGRIHTAVVHPKGDLAQPCHLALARLMQDLSRLRIPFRVKAGGLRGCQIGQDSFGNLRRQPEELQSGDDSVAAEDGAEPGHPGVGVEPELRLDQKHTEIGSRAIEPIIELLIGGIDFDAPERGGT